MYDSIAVLNTLSKVSSFWDSLNSLFSVNAKPYYDLERNLDFLALKNKYQAESDRLKNEGNSRISEGQVYAIDYLNLKGEDISNEDIATIYPIFSIMEDYENLIKVLSVSVNRDNTNAEYLEVLRNAYMKIKNYEKAEDIYQMILKLQWLLIFIF